MMKRILLLAITLLLFSLPALAQQVTFTAAAPLNVVAGDRFRVEFVLTNGQGENFTAPKFEGLTVLVGPTVSSGTQMSWFNGVQSSSTSETYTYFVEASATATKASISPASITVGGTVRQTKSLAINIVKAGSPQGRASGGTAGGGASHSGYDQPTSRPTGRVAPDDMLLRIELSKKECFKGEAISAQLKLYTRVSISGIKDAKYSAFNGFWTQEIESANPPQSARATINGKVYEGYVLRQWLIYPQKAGTMEIEQTTITLLAQIVNQSDVSSLFDQFFGGGSSVSTIEKTLSTGTTRLVVKSLPEAGSPIGLIPAVGKFTLSSKLSSDKIAANSAGSLTVKLTGTGDFPLLETPAFKLPAEFEQYDTKTTDNLKSTLAGTTGSKEWEFPFIARSEGRYTIPSIEIAYFDPATKAYHTLRSEQYDIEITRDTGAGAATVVAGNNKEDLKMLGQDIRYIKTTPLRTSGGEIWMYSLTFFLTIFALVGVFVALLFVFRRQMVRRADVVGSKNRKASKVALRRLKAAKKSMDAADRRAFLEEMLRALWGFVGDKFNIEVSELTKARIEQEFTAHNTQSELSSEFLDIVSDCEMAQYAPSTSLDMGGVYGRALTLFDSL